MHIYQCFLVLIVALMHLPNIYENVWKTKTQAPWPPLLVFFLSRTSPHKDITHAGRQLLNELRLGWAHGQAAKMCC